MKYVFFTFFTLFLTNILFAQTYAPVDTASEVSFRIKKPWFQYNRLL